MIWWPVTSTARTTRLKVLLHVKALNGDWYPKGALRCILLSSRPPSSCLPASPEQRLFKSVRLSTPAYWLAPKLLCETTQIIPFQLSALVSAALQIIPGRIGSQLVWNLAAENGRACGIPGRIWHSRRSPDAISSPACVFRHPWMRRRYRADAH